MAARILDFFPVLTTSTTVITTTTTREPNCGEAITAESGVIMTEGYPDEAYSGRLDCEWTLTVPDPAARVQFKFTGMDVRIYE